LPEIGFGAHSTMVAMLIAYMKTNGRAEAKEVDLGAEHRWRFVKGM
jgi:hypothetical protein